MDFYIVTPTYQSERFLAETIESVLSQVGDFSLHYHIQDGGSSDSTVQIISGYEKRIGAGEFSSRKRSLRFTWASGKDAGMYDAINRGFEKTSGEICAWINSDDVYLPGALANMNSAFTRFPELDWIKGVTRYIDDRSEVLSEGECFFYDRRWIRRGIYGNEAYFIQQDSVFWRRTLWEHAGPIDPALKLAGDFAVWYKFAAITSLATLNVPVSAFRKVAGQLSQDIRRYRSEMATVSGGRKSYPLIRFFFRLALRDPTPISQILFTVFFRKRAIFLKPMSDGSLAKKITYRFSRPARKA
jgi:glycosyltransferase involved in cell wall biosynthesis